MTEVYSLELPDKLDSLATLSSNLQRHFTQLRNNWVRLSLDQT